MGSHSLFLNNVVPYHFDTARKTISIQNSIGIADMETKGEQKSAKSFPLKPSREYKIYCHYHFFLKNSSYLKK